MRRLVIVGGGVSGLATAFRATALDADLDVTVVEAAAEPGGKVRTLTVGDLTLPAGADAVVARKPWAADLCRELGLELEEPGDSGAYLWTERGLVPYLRDSAFGIPGDVGEVLRWPGLSGAGRRRALVDLVRRKRRGDADETLGGMLRRRLGDEATDLALAPLLAGLHAGDVDRLSMRATFPELAAWEAAQGSLIRGAQAARRTAGRAGAGPLFVRPAGGVERLLATLAGRLGHRVRTGAAALGIDPGPRGWVVRTATGDLEADVVVLAVPAADAVPLVRSISSAAADGIGRIRAVSTACIVMVYEPGTAGALPPGTGFVVPRGRAPMTACTWLSNKWPSAGFGDRAVLRCYVGAAGDEDVLEADDGDLIDACALHLGALLALPPRPEHAGVARWPGAMPQYELGHLERVASIRRALPAGIFVTGQSYDGVGIADCVRAANETAAAIVGVTMSSTRAEESLR